MSGFRRRSIHRKRPDKSVVEQQEADDEAYHKMSRHNSIAEMGGDVARDPMGAVPAMGSFDDGDDAEGFKSKFTDKILQELPSITKEKDIKKQRKTFIAKMEQCCVVFDFSRKNGLAKNPAKLASSKMVKRKALMEAIDFVMTAKGAIDSETFQAIVQVVAENCFRSFETADDPTAPAFDPEDDEPILETGWPHLSLVYTLLLKTLDQKALNVDLFVSVAGTEFVSRLVANMGSCDPRERDSAKSCVHRAYGRFMPIRASIRKMLKDVMIRLAYDTTAVPFHGAQELLEFYGCIVNGFVSPIKDEHKAMLVGGLLPLHRCKSLAVYHRQLVYCVTQFLSKAPDLVHVVLPYILAHWPRNNAPKEMLYMSELEGIMRAIDAPTLDDIFELACRRIAKCAQSVHFMVAERALSFWNNPIFLRQVRKDLSMAFPILAPALHLNSKRHWSGSIHDHNDNAIEVMNEIDADMFMELAPAQIQSEKADRQTARASMESKWDRLAAMAKANPIGNQVGVTEGVPTGPSAVPDVFMKGETTSPHRQYRLHKRRARPELDKLRHPDDVAARARAAKEEADEEAEEEKFDDETDEEDSEVVMRRQHTLSEAVSPTGTVPAGNPRSALTRRKSTLVLPNAKEVEKELEDFEPNPMEAVPPSPITSPMTSPVVTPIGSDDDDDGGGGAAGAAAGTAGPPPTPSFSHNVPVPDEEEGLVPVPRVAGPHDNGCWMVKRSAGTFKRSNRRWFAIESSKGRIAYYSQEVGAGLPSAEPRGTIRFKDIMKVGQSNRQLVIVSSRRPKFTLTAATTAISQQWAQALAAALNSDGPAGGVAVEGKPAPAGLASVPASKKRNAKAPPEGAPGAEGAKVEEKPRVRRSSGEYGFSPTEGNSPVLPVVGNGADANGSTSPADIAYGFGSGDEFVGDDWDLEA
mmetsp:Transcript_4875/g.12550  ORF Transcript_4875/g.12550 Transcript_4875/m.12550 type:complete len:920 (-) Transcript_4875:44-2803(-)